MNTHRIILAAVALLCAACASVAPASGPPGTVTPTTGVPTAAPTGAPTPEATATQAPSATPTDAPTVAPTEVPSEAPATALPSPGEGSLEETLLTAEDLPDGLASAGIVEGSNFDIDQASFDLYGGEEIVSQVWQGTSGTIAAVFDFRMRFPDAASAGSYLDAAEAVLSEEVGSGLTNTPITDLVGENTSYYTGQGTAGSATIDFHNFLFTVDSVAVKVFFAGQGATYEEVLPIAQAAAEHIERVFGDASGGALDELLSQVRARMPIAVRRT